MRATHEHTKAAVMIVAAMRAAWDSVLTKIPRLVMLLLSDVSRSRRMEA